MFSHRTNWHRQPNRLSELLEVRRARGKPIIDLTVSNPTECGFQYPQQEILSTLNTPQVLRYHPDPRGLLSARQAVSEYYRTKGIIVDPTNIFLTACTSEAYSLIFKLLCNVGENVLVPRPSYPLFEYLAQINDVNLRHYKLYYDHGWHVDIDLLSKRTPSEKDCINKSLKAIVLVNPHNPTGMFLKQNEYEQIVNIAQEHKLALIVDEVFIDYSFAEDKHRFGSTAASSNVLTFTLNGISKSLGLPQMKLGWIIVNGQLPIVNEAMERLEILCDTFLSVNTPVQVALPALLTIGKNIQNQLRNRLKTNYTILQTLLTTHQSQLTNPCSLLATEGGWYGIIRVPRMKSDEQWAIELLEAKGISIYPGYYFDFDEEGYLVVSLLVDQMIFQQSIAEIIDFVCKT